MSEKERPVKKRRLADSVEDRIIAMIHSGELKEGNRLPPERTLAESMGVSRTVIRQAIRSLAEKDILELRDGRGYVRQVPFEEIIENISRTLVPDEVSMKEIMEVRMLLESYIARKATENITEEQIARLQGEIDKMALLMERGENGSTQENAFHRGLAEAAGNSVLNGVYMFCEGLLNSTQHGTWLGARAGGSPNTAIRDHQAILDAIRERNPDKAERLMRGHMEYAAHNLKQFEEATERSQIERNKGE
ncbi:MAG: FadR family transcriptional regulator [Lachnospiraceae bacterium]|nr:FadR family transcriptional regulator [Lachnospiraceae bacterium]MCD8249358.1 FadR family transcriptional regulator [Lachnospiraceae bacterium]